ncbi:transcription factor IIA, alpha/beta subunit domain-containing protein [Sarocladium implicatum]|nr:transcription factor IIA, alpha/beta subunit domain-containing protein [Sarocladium implicatum]
MSNTAVGNVYQTIIDEVINSSRVDFEENGIEESVLDELRNGWQSKLSGLGVAQFPWDPKPEAPAPAAAVDPGPARSVPPANPSPAPVHSQAQFTPQLNLPAGNAAATEPLAPHNGIKQEHGTQQYQNSNGPAIKQEPGMQPDPSSLLPQHYGGPAAMRAAQHIAARFGSQAQNSINALQGPQQQQQQGQQPQQPEVAQRPPPPAHPTPARTQEEYRQQMAANTAAMQQHHTSLGNGQTDGPAEVEDDDQDFEAVLMRKSEAGELQELGRVDVDKILHQHIAARAKAMEGGGLMVPLQEATRHRAPMKTSSSATSEDKESRKVAGYDGGDDEDDEDAINSDLDDPEDDEADPEADEDGLGHIMLCMYDKVQRVKNKWKCTLKDGVLTVNGKEYVFHKATGEYEW